MPILAVEEAIQRVRQQLTDYPQADYYYNEATTRIVLIDPVLEALGWDLRNLDQCGYETDPKGEQWGKKPADYVLANQNGRTVIVIEAKSIYNRLTAEKVEEQLAGYAEGLLSGFAVLTNGINWYIYNLRMRRGFADKLAGEVNLLESDIAQGARILSRWMDASQWW